MLTGMFKTVKHLKTAKKIVKSVNKHKKEYAVLIKKGQEAVKGRMKLWR